MSRGLTLSLVLLLSLAAVAVADTQYWMSGVPDYNWYNGCSPTSGGILVGYWDHQTGYEGLYSGSAPSYLGPGSTDLFNQVIASDDHELKYYVKNECTHTNVSPPSTSGPNSLACFMHTTPGAGASYDWNIATGLRRYAAWDGGGKTAYDFNSILGYTATPSWPAWANAASFTFQDLRGEIDAGRPLLLNLSLNGGGHSVVAYGYWEDAIGTPWYAVRDTWQDGNSNGTYGVVSQMNKGQEWWQWDLEATGDTPGADYYVSNAVPFAPNPGGAVHESSDYGNVFANAFQVDVCEETFYASLSNTGDFDFFKIWMNPGDRLWAMTQDDQGFTQSIDTLLQLYDPEAQLVEYSYDFWGAGNTGTSYLLYQADQSGWWRVAVSGHNASVTGNYALSLNLEPIPEPATLVLLAGGLATLLLRRRRRTAA